MSDPLRIEILRPGPTRTELEAETYAETRPCPNCGGRVSLSDAFAPQPTDGGVWEVILDCHMCGSILRYFFDAAPEWSDKPADDPDMFSNLFGPEGTKSALFNASDLRQLIEDTLPHLETLETQLAASPIPPPDLLLQQVAQWGQQALRALREMQAQDIPLTDKDLALRARLEAHEAAIRS